MTGYSRRSNPYPDAPAEQYRQQATGTDGEHTPPDRQKLSWWQDWGERTFYLVVFVAFVALLVVGGTWR